MTSEKKIKLFTMSYCPFCTRAKQLLQQRGIVFEEVLVAEDDEVQWDNLFKKSGMRTMPQIFFGESLIGGYSELAALDQKDQLNSLKNG